MPSTPTDLLTGSHAVNDPGFVLWADQVDTAILAALNPPAGGVVTLTPTGVKTTNYTAVANDLVPANVTSASLTVTLPATPTDGVRVGVKVVALGGSNSVTVNSGSIPLSISTGGTTYSLANLNQAAIFQYSSANNVWYVLDNVPVSVLNAGTGVGPVGAWAASTAYVVSNMRWAAGRLWRCITAHTSGATFDPSKWEPWTAGVIDPTQVSPLWSPSGMTDTGFASGGTPNNWSSTNATANTASLKAALAYAATLNAPIRFPAGVWDINGGGSNRPLQFLTDIPIMTGAGVDNTWLRFGTGNGVAGGSVSAATDATTGYTITTADGKGCGILVGNNMGNYSGPGGYVADLTIAAGNGQAPNPGLYLGNPSTSVGLCVNGVTMMAIERVRVVGFGVAFDMINNSGGTQFTNCTAPYGQNYVALQYRTNGQSGADVSLYNCWFHGRFAAIMVESGSSDLQVYGGQLAGNTQNSGSFSTPQDGVAAIVFNRNALDGTFAADGLPGTHDTGACGMFDFRNVDMEGTRLGYAAYRAYGYVNVCFSTCNFVVYAKDGTSPTSYDSSQPGVSGLIKHTGAGESNVKIRDCQIKGCFSSSTLVSFAGDTGGFIFSCQDNTGKGNTAINGYNGGNQPGGNWLQIDAVSGNPTNLARFSGMTNPYRGMGGPYLDLSGVFLRGNGTHLQWSVAGGTWTTI